MESWVQAYLSRPRAHNRWNFCPSQETMECQLRCLFIVLSGPINMMFPISSTSWDA